MVASLVLRMFVLSLAATICGVRSDVSPGANCKRDGRPGRCIEVYQCTEVIKAVNEENKPPPLPCFVSPEDGTVYVCCLSAANNTISFSTISSTQAHQNNCTKSLPVRGERISRQKCREYAGYVCTVEKSPTFAFDPDVLVDRCVWSGEGLIVGGTKALLGEFPHMAALGYGDDPQTLSYDCGGSLISEDYVLTAAHCLHSLLPLSHVLLGDLALYNNTDGASPELIPVRTDGKIRHPKYRPSTRYYDVALLRLAWRPTFSPNLRPACLHAGEGYPQNSLVATGWGTKEFLGDKSDVLLKVSLMKIAFAPCNASYRLLSNILPRGILDDQQFCAGHAEWGRDTCQADSGGPLQVYRNDPHCTHEIIGITSFGKGCGNGPKSPGVYTRVQYFVKWIEDIVWPSGARNGVTIPAR